MLIIQRKKGSNKRRERNELMQAANEPLCGWQADGPTGPEGGILHAYFDRLSGRIGVRIETSCEETLSGVKK